MTRAIIDQTGSRRHVSEVINSAHEATEPERWASFVLAAVLMADVCLRAAVPGMELVVAWVARCRKT
jgi:hypothetical protein